MGLFSKKPKAAVCELCGKADLEGCAGTFSHVEQISATGPAWLPEGLRVQAQGEYAWLCLICDSYPAMKWPSDSAAAVSLTIHLGQAHNAGRMRDIAGSMDRINMIPAG